MMRYRLRVSSRVDESGRRTWYAQKLDREGEVLEEHEAANEYEAEQSMNTYRRYGAWKKS